MILGIMQPYFFPYVGYFDLIDYADRWIVFDPVQYIRHGWINRNRILHPKEGWQYVTVPLRKHARETPIKDVEVNDDLPWREKIAGQLQHYRKRAPYFRETLALVEDCLALRESAIGRLNAGILAKLCTHLGIEFSFRVFSDMDLALGPIQGPGDWALEIATALGAHEYVNPPGGEAIFDRQAFAARGIELTIRRLPTLEYACRGYGFEPGLSIIDVLMWNTPGQVRQFLRAHRAAPAAVSA